MRLARLFWALAALVLLCEFDTLGQTPMGTGFTYQGQLKYGGNKLTGAVDLTFGLYRCAEGGDQLAEAEVSNVPVVDGLFTVPVDFETAELFDGEARWLEIAVDDPNDPEPAVILSPRQQITPTPYALQTRGLFVNDDGNVGIGTTTPAQVLDVSVSENGQGIRIQANTETGSDRAPALQLWPRSQSPNERNWAISAYRDTNQGLSICSSNEKGGDPYHGSSSTTRLYIDGISGNVGIGTSAPQERLDVAGGNVRIDTGRKFMFFGNEGQSYLRQNMGGVAIWASGVGHAVFTDMNDNSAPTEAIFSIVTGVDNSASDSGSTDQSQAYSGDDVKLLINKNGNVGIGTTNPAAKLDVEGNAAISSTLWVEDLISSESVMVGDDAWIDDDLFMEGRFEKRRQGWANALVVIDQDGSGSSSCGYVTTYGSNLNRNVHAGHTTDDMNGGWCGVFDSSGIPQAAMYVDSAGRGVIYKDINNFRMPNPNETGTEIWYASLEGPEAAAYVRGTARLTNGRAVILLPDHFVSVASQQAMTVQVTPLSAESKGLAVVEKSLEGVVVQELFNGTGSYDFDWTVMSVRRGYEDYRVIRPAEEGVPAPAVQPEALADIGLPADIAAAGDTEVSE